MDLCLQCVVFLSIDGPGLQKHLVNDYYCCYYTDQNSGKSYCCGGVADDENFRPLKTMPLRSEVHLGKE